MGEAFDRSGNVLGHAFGATKAEVFDALNKAHGDAHEIRIKTISDQLRESQAGGASTQMPRYRSHKEVYALKIAAIQRDSDVARAEGRETDGSAIITPTDAGFAPFAVDAAYLRKHDPQVGGYYVQYADGYTSFSPAAPFEEGYTRI